MWKTFNTLPLQSEVWTQQKNASRILTLSLDMLGSVPGKYTVQHGGCTQAVTLGLRNHVKIRLVALAIILSLLVPYIISPSNETKYWPYLAPLHIDLCLPISLVIRIFRKNDLKDLVTMHVKRVEEKLQQQILINLWRHLCDCSVPLSSGITSTASESKELAQDTLLLFLY